MGDRLTAVSGVGAALLWVGVLRATVATRRPPAPPRARGRRRRVWRWWRASTTSTSGSTSATRPPTPPATSPAEAAADPDGVIVRRRGRDSPRRRRVLRHLRRLERHRRRPGRGRRPDARRAGRHRLHPERAARPTSRWSSTASDAEQRVRRLRPSMTRRPARCTRRCSSACCLVGAGRRRRRRRRSRSDEGRRSGAGSTSSSTTRGVERRRRQPEPRSWTSAPPTRARRRGPDDGAVVAPFPKHAGLSSGLLRAGGTSAVGAAAVVRSASPPRLAALVAGALVGRIGPALGRPTLWVTGPGEPARSSDALPSLLAHAARRGPGRGRGVRARRGARRARTRRGTSGAAVAVSRSPSPRWSAAGSSFGRHSAGGRERGRARSSASAAGWPPRPSAARARRRSAWRRAPLAGRALRRRSTLLDASLAGSSPTTVRSTAARAERGSSDACAATACRSSRQLPARRVPASASRCVRGRPSGSPPRRCSSVRRVVGRRALALCGVRRSCSCAADVGSVPGARRSSWRRCSPACSASAPCGSARERSCCRGRAAGRSRASVAVGVAGDAVRHRRRVRVGWPLLRDRRCRSSSPPVLRLRPSSAGCRRGDGRRVLRRAASGARRPARRARARRRIGRDAARLEDRRRSSSPSSGRPGDDVAGRGDDASGRAWQHDGARPASRRRLDELLERLGQTALDRYAERRPRRRAVRLVDPAPDLDAPVLDGASSRLEFWHVPARLRRRPRRPAAESNARSPTRGITPL